MKILHVHKVKGISGSEKHLIDLLPGLVAQHEIHFLVLEEPGLPQDHLISQFSGSGVIVHRMPITKHFSLGLIVRLVRFIQKMGFNCLHTHLIHADIHGAFAAKIAGVPVVSSKHGWDIYEKMSLPQCWLLRQASRLTKGFIAISHALVEILKQHEGVAVSKISVVHYGLNPVPPFPVKSGTLPCVQKSQIFRFLYLGRLVPEKGVYELLDAAQLLQEQGVTCEFSLAGTGPLFEPLKKYIQEKKTTNVCLLGFQKEIIPQMLAHDALILPTYGEGFGLVCLEAMACYRAVLASDVTALPEIIVDGVTGVLFKPRNANAIVSAVKQVLNADRLKQMGIAGNDRLRNDFSREAMVTKTLEFYRHHFQKTA